MYMPLDILYEISSFLDEESHLHALCVWKEFPVYGLRIKQHKKWFTLQRDTFVLHKNTAARFSYLHTTLFTPVVIRCAYADCGEKHVTCKRIFTRHGVEWGIRTVLLSPYCQSHARTHGYGLSPFERL